MPRHKPIKFITTLEPRLIKRVKEIITENKQAKSVLNATMALVAVGGILTLSVLAPGVLGEINKMLYRKKKNNYEQYRQIWRGFNSLKQKRNLEFVKEEDGYLIYRFSQKGKDEVRKFIIDELSIGKPKNWDGKWRLAIFDIPEKRKNARVGLRKKLSDIGFYQCQKSAWVYPFPCEKEVEFLKDFFNVKPFVKLFLVDEMTDGKVLYHFRDLLKKI